MLRFLNLASFAAVASPAAGPPPGGIKMRGAYAGSARTSVGGAALRLREALHAGLAVGFGRIVASEILPPNLLVNLV